MPFKNKRHSQIVGISQYAYFSSLLKKKVKSLKFQIGKNELKNHILWGWKIWNLKFDAIIFAFKEL
jgi:hypothetical protein